MALPSTVYRATIQLSDLDRGIYETLQTTVARHPSETAERLAARLLAYAACYEEGISFTRGIAAGDEPDLWVKTGDGRISLWIEIGLPDPERLVKAARHAERVVLFANGQARPRWQEQHLAKLTGIGNLTILAVEQPFLNRLAESVERAINWSITITEGALYLTVGDETLETGLERVIG